MLLVICREILGLGYYGTRNEQSFWIFNDPCAEFVIKKHKYSLSYSVVPS